MVKRNRARGGATIPASTSCEEHHGAAQKMHEQRVHKPTFCINYMIQCHNIHNMMAGQDKMVLKTQRDVPPPEHAVQPRYSGKFLVSLHRDPLHEWILIS
jgi:hypothetical protein